MRRSPNRIDCLGCYYKDDPDWQNVDGIVRCKRFFLQIWLFRILNIDCWKTFWQHQW